MGAYAHVSYGGQLMPGRFTLTADAAQLRDSFPGVEVPDQWLPRYNIAPGGPVAVISNQNAQAVDFVLADELTHVRFGSDWVREFTRDDPDRAARAKEFQRETDKAFSFGGQRELAREERLEAGFTEEELDEIEAIDGAGPKRSTLVRAAEMLRDRHRARQRGEEVAPL